MTNAPRVWLDRELTAFAASIPAGALVLDAGAGGQRYKPKFNHCQYESADHNPFLMFLLGGDTWFNEDSRVQIRRGEFPCE